MVTCLILHKVRTQSVKLEVTYQMALCKSSGQAAIRMVECDLSAVFLT